MFDAANCMRMGKHILFNSSSKNSDLGIQWLQQVLGNDYKVLKTDITDTHIDSTFLPLRPGLALLLKPDKKNLLPKCIQNWDLISIPLRDRSLEDQHHQGVKLASPRIELNVLSIDKSTIICHPEYRNILNDKLKKYKFDVIPCRMRHCELFSGAHHCLTLDVRRNSKLENYF
jgi:glycine amidinotransferase